MPNQPREGFKARSVKVEDELWEAAMERAAERGEPLSAAIRAFLKRYVAKKN